MGMEGKLRQVSEFELAAYRKTPSKFYSELMAKYQSGNFSKFISMAQEFGESKNRIVRPPGRGRS